MSSRPLDKIYGNQLDEVLEAFQAAEIARIDRMSLQELRYTNPLRMIVEVS